MRVRLVLAVAAGLGLVLATAPARAHHAVQASVDVEKTIKTQAVLTKVDWVNPHTWMRFDIAKPDGKVETNVLIESLGIAALRKVGIDSKSAFKVGEKYNIYYFPNRDGSIGGFMTRMELPDVRAFDTKYTDPSAGIK